MYVQYLITNTVQIVSVSKGSFAMSSQDSEAFLLVMYVVMSCHHMLMLHVIYHRVIFCHLVLFHIIGAS